MPIPLADFPDAIYRAPERILDIATMLVQNHPNTLRNKFEQVRDKGVGDLRDARLDEIVDWTHDESPAGPTPKPHAARGMPSRPPR